MALEVEVVGLGVLAQLMVSEMNKIKQNLSIRAKLMILSSEKRF